MISCAYVYGNTIYHGHGAGEAKSRFAKCHPWLLDCRSDSQGWRACSRIVWNNPCLVADGLYLASPIPYPLFYVRLKVSGTVVICFVLNIIDLQIVDFAQFFLLNN